MYLNKYSIANVEIKHLKSNMKEKYGNLKDWERTKTSHVEKIFSYKKADPLTYYKFFNKVKCNAVYWNCHILIYKCLVHGRVDYVSYRVQSEVGCNRAALVELLSRRIGPVRGTLAVLVQAGRAQLPVPYIMDSRKNKFVFYAQIEKQNWKGNCNKTGSSSTEMLFLHFGVVNHACILIKLYAATLLFLFRSWSGRLKQGSDWTKCRVFRMHRIGVSLFSFDLVQFNYANIFFCFSFLWEKLLNVCSDVGFMNKVFYDEYQGFLLLGSVRDGSYTWNFVLANKSVGTRFFFRV